MAGINGMGLTFNLPNFHGPLYQVTPSDAPFTSAIGGLSDGGRPTLAKDFEWQTYDLRAVENPSHLEGQNAPAARGRARTNVSNVCQIFHDTVEVSYTKLAATAQRDGINIAREDGSGGDELSWQIEQSLKALKRDIEHVFINGVYARPADNTAARKTRGILSAITTNVVQMPDADPGAAGLQPSPLTEKAVLDLMQAVWVSGGIQEEEAATLMCNAGVKRQLTTIFITNKNYSEETRNVGGVRVTTIETDFGRVNVMLNRYMPAGELAVVSLDVCAPRLLLIPEKGFLFAEPLAKAGASDRVQIYGEIGLEYGAENQHGKITNIAA